MRCVNGMYEEKRPKGEGRRMQRLETFRWCSNTPLPLPPVRRSENGEDIAENIKAVPLSGKTVGIAEQRFIRHRGCGAPHAAFLP